MHEWSLVCALLQQVEDLAAEHPGTQVQSIRIRVGEFCGVDADLIASAYEQLVEESPLVGAMLEIEPVPLEAACLACGNVGKVLRLRFECGVCGSSELELRSGEELLLDSVTLVEVET